MNNKDKTNLQTKQNFTRWDEDYSRLVVHNTAALQRKINFPMFFFFSISLTEESDCDLKSIYCLVSFAPKC